MIRNPQRDAIPSDISIEDFGRAMAQLDLSSIPQENRMGAIIDHLARIIMDTATDRSVAIDLATAYVLRNRR